jgi:predicted phosphodiesterase
MDEGMTRQNIDSIGSHRGRDAVDRRTVLKSALMAAAGPAVLSLSCASNRMPSGGRRPVRFGMVTDCHYADADPIGTRFYRESLDKLTECVARMNAEKVDFLIELGDFKDQGSPPMERDTLAYLQEVEAAFQRFDGPKYHVLGNHDADSISKTQFLARVSNTGIDPVRSFYSFDVKGLHCIVLDANYRSDGVDYDHGQFDWTDANIPAHELDWLRKNVAATSGPAVVFIHQLLDGTDSVCVKNAEQVRGILEESGKVQAVFQGHHHEGRHEQIDGIHYYTLRALVEGQGQNNNSYAIVEVAADLTIRIIGYDRAVSATL